MPAIIVCAVLLLACAVGAVWSEISSRGKVRAQALARFGKLPDGQYGLEGIPSYAELCAELRRGGVRVDAATWNDLDMDKVFRRINGCQSAVGEQFLYERLHRLDPGLKDEGWEALLGHLETAVPERERLLVLLARLGKRGGGLSIFLADPVEYPLPLGSLYRVLAWLPFAALPLPFLFPLPGFCILFASVCVNFVLFYLGKREVQGDLDRLRYLSSLLWLCKKLVGGALSFPPLRERISAALPCFRPLLGNSAPTPQKGTSDLELLGEYFHILTLRDLRVYRRSMRLISAHQEELRELFEAVGLLDAALCVLSFRRTLPVWSAPVFSGENRLQFSGLYHPLLRSPVPNSGEFEKDILLTGSNASGKSTFLKALAVNAILAQSLGTCAAERLVFRPGPILTSMAVRDDITAGESYFIAEIKSLKRLMDAAGTSPCLLFIDEILKGTNTVERLAASQAVLEELHRRDCLCIAATHDQELPQRLSDSYRNYHFQEELTPEGIEFDYRLRPGPANTQNALELLDLMGFRQAVTLRARQLAETGPKPAEREEVQTYESKDHHPGL